MESLSEYLEILKGRQLRVFGKIMNEVYQGSLRQIEYFDKLLSALSASISDDSLESRLEELSGSFIERGSKEKPYSVRRYKVRYAKPHKKEKPSHTKKSRMRVIDYKKYLELRSSGLNHDDIKSKSPHMNLLTLRGYAASYARFHKKK